MERSVRAFETGCMISNTLEMESLLFAAGTRQCSIAASFGIHEGENSVYVCCYPARTSVWTALDPLFHFGTNFPEGIDPEKREQRWNCLEFQRMRLQLPAVSAG